MTTIEPYCNGIGCPDKFRLSCDHYKEKINTKKEIHWGVIPYDEKRDICTHHPDHKTKFSSLLDEYIKKNGKN